MAKPGYSILEILTVVAIIGFITAVGVVNFRQGENQTLLQLRAEELVNVFRELQLKAMNRIEFNNYQPLGGYGWLANDWNEQGLTRTYSLFIRTQVSNGPYNPSIDIIMSTTTLQAGFYLLPGGLLTINFKPLDGSVEGYLADGQVVSWPAVGVASNRITDRYLRVMVNSQSGALTTETVFQSLTLP